MQHKPIEIVIIDDHPMVIEGLKTLLEGFESLSVKNYFTTGKEALKYVNSNAVDVILLDVNLPDISGIDMAKLILAKNSQSKILGLSTYNEASIITQMIRNGVKGYLLKNASADELCLAIKQVHSNNVYYGNEVQKILTESIAQEIVEVPQLTRREKHILQLIADGKKTNDIAEELFISPLTVETHRRNLMQKMDVSNAAAMVKYAIQNGLL